ncbi:MAG: hypothetical protein H8D34_21430, partial [Chloroflexi bacterium]|nr:hypothetical protein [Chloroflexota bacterium]
MLANKPKYGPRRVWFGLWIVFIGLVLFLLGLEPDLFRADRSPVVGFVQIAVFLVGLAFICLGGYMSFSLQWAGDERTIAADIGLRLVSTGYVIALVSGLADVFGFGTQPFPEIPYFGPLQAAGVILGEVVIAIGFVLVVLPNPDEPEPKRRKGKRESR